MRSRCLLITATVAVLSVSSLFAQYGRGGSRHFADHRDTINFLSRARMPDIHHPKKEADDEDRMKIPHNLAVPPGANIIQEDFSAPAYHQIPPGHAYTPPASPVPTNTFGGLVDNNTYVPPDVNGAVGPNYVMETLNSQVSISSRTGSLVSKVSLYNFWPSSFNLAEAFDPRVLYDPYGQRWIVVCGANPNTDSSAFLIGISESKDPTAQWYTYKIAVDASKATWLDYPSIGFSKNWIIVNGNMYDVSNGDWSGTKLWILDKSDYYVGSTGSYTAIEDSLIGGTVAPCTNFDSTSTTQYLVQTWNGGAGYIALYEVTGPIGSETFSNVAFIVTPNVWASEGPSGWNFAPQLGSTNLISTNDDRMQKAVYRNGNIWCVHTVCLPATSPSRSSVQWWELSTAGAITQRSVIDDSAGGRFYAFPSIAVNSSNEVMIGYASFGASQYASSDYSYQNSCNPLNAMSSDYLFKAGLAPYYKTYGGAYNRWGDYSATCVDPLDDNTLWTVQEYADSLSGTTSEWATSWAEFTPNNTNGGTGTWTWTGLVSTSWFDACNWDQGVLPGINSDVVIPGGTLYNPTITGAAASCNSLTLYSSNGATLTIDDANSGALNINQ